MATPGSFKLGDGKELVGRIGAEGVIRRLRIMKRRVTPSAPTRPTG
jgi:hypothetical protein